MLLNFYNLWHTLEQSKEQMSIGHLSYHNLPQDGSGESAGELVAGGQRQPALTPPPEAAVPRGEGPRHRLDNLLNIYHLLIPLQVRTRFRFWNINHEKSKSTICLEIFLDRKIFFIMI